MNKLKELINYAKILQAGLCSYGTVDGDGGKCDCKFAEDSSGIGSLSESGCGCAEARSLIWGLEKLQQFIETKEKELDREKIRFESGDVGFVHVYPQQELLQEIKKLIKQL